MGNKKRKHSQKFKEEIVQRALSGERILELGKENNLSPGLINRWKRQYLDVELNNNTGKEVKKLETQVGKLEQMIGKLTMENYIQKKIEDISREHPYYGYRRITAQLRREKVIVNHKKVLKMMKELGIQGRIKHKYIATTNSKHNNRIYSNLVKDKELTGINQVWCADITYIRILNGFIYLAAILGIYSPRKIVGYAIGKTLSPKLAIPDFDT